MMRIYLPTFLLLVLQETLKCIEKFFALIQIFVNFGSEKIFFRHTTLLAKGLVWQA